MTLSRRYRILLGAAVVLVAAILFGITMFRLRSPLARSISLIVRAPREVMVKFSADPGLEPGAPVFMLANRKVLKVGFVVHPASPSDDGYVIGLRLFHDVLQPIGDSSRFVVLGPDTIPRWTYENVLTEEKKKFIENELKGYFRMVKPHIQEQLLPILGDIARQLLNATVDALTIELEKRKEKIQEISLKYKPQIMDTLQDIFFEQILPDLKKEGAPLYNRIAREAWENFPWKEVSLSLMKDAADYLNSKIFRKSREHHVKQTLDRYIQDLQDIIISNYKKEFMALIETVITRNLEKEEVQDAFRAISQKIGDDDQIKGLFWDALVGAVVENAAFRDILMKAIGSEMLGEQVFYLAGQFEPYLVSILQFLLIDEETQTLSGDIVLLIRNKLNEEDNQMIVLEPVFIEGGSWSAVKGPFYGTIYRK
jgi:hypothetical protein